MRRMCAVSGKEFESSPADLEFYVKMGVPPPDLCPEERLRRRMAYRNFRTLHHRRCSATGKSLISMYPASSPFPVYDYDYWWSDRWDGSSFGRSYDPSRSFFEQYKELASSVPRFAVMNSECENCRYSNFALRSKNCYLIFGCVDNEDCLYGHIVWESDHCVDNLYVYQSQWCSNSVDLVGCYDTHYSTESTRCRESMFLHDCMNCQNCFACFNLRGREYCFFNRQLSRDEYRRRMAEYVPLTAAKAAEAAAWLAEAKMAQAVYPPHFALQAEETTGNHIYYSQKLHHCFDAKKTEECSYCFTVIGAFGSRDLCFGPGRFCLEGVFLGNCEECLCCNTCLNSSALNYCEFCFSSQDLFGCIGMRRARYCILNKQYTQEEFSLLRARIVQEMEKRGEWGQFFPAADSVFAYNESIANEYLPLSKKEALNRGLRWAEDDNRASKPAAKAVPPKTSEAGEDVLQAVYSCADTGKPYKIIAPELDFYRRMNLPLPARCPDRRHELRMAARGPRTLYFRSCPACGICFQSCFSPEAPERALCEPCYQHAIAGSN